MRKIKKRPSCPVVAAKLREYTHLTAQCSNVTRWSSTALMLTRYFEIEDHLVNIEEVENMLPAPRSARNLKRLREIFGQLDIIGKDLQKDSTNLADVLALFDTVMEEYPEAAQVLASTARVVHSPHLESVIIKYWTSKCLTYLQMRLALLNA